MEWISQWEMMVRATMREMMARREPASARDEEGRIFVSICLKDESGEGHDGSAEAKEAEGDFAADFSMHESPEHDGEAQEPDEESFPDFWVECRGCERALDHGY